MNLIHSKTHKSINLKKMKKKIKKLNIEFKLILCSQKESLRYLS